MGGRGRLESRGSVQTIPANPEFEAAAADMPALFVIPSQHAAVFCVDGKSHIQALDRLDPVPRRARAEFVAFPPQVVACGVFTSTANLASRLLRYVGRANKAQELNGWSYADPTRRIPSLRSTSAATGH